MLKRDYQDIITGALLISIGLAAAVYAGVKYDFGTFAQMGPAMFPVGIGTILAVIGLIILVPAMFRNGPPVSTPDIRTFFFIAAALMLFVVTVENFGLVPAVILLVVTATFADNKLSVLGTILLTAILAALAWFVFIFALGVPLAPFRTP